MHAHTHKHTESENGVCVLHNWCPWQKPTLICILREPRVNDALLKHVITSKHTLQTSSSMRTCQNTRTSRRCPSKDEQYDSLTYLTLWSVPSVCSSALLLFSVSLSHTYTDTHTLTCDSEGQIERGREKVCLNVTDCSQLSTLLPQSSRISNILDTHKHSKTTLSPFLKKPLLSHSHQISLSPPISSLSALQCESHSSSHAPTLPSPLGGYKYHCCYEYTVFFPQHPSLHQKLHLFLSHASVIPPFSNAFSPWRPCHLSSQHRCLTTSSLHVFTHAFFLQLVAETTQQC